MHVFKLTIVLALSLISIVLSGQQQQEVVIIGTMHTVPGIVSNAYKPMAKKAIRYQPQAIYVERQPAWDTTSVKNYFPKFYAKSDSLKKVMTFDDEVISKLQTKPLANLTKEEANQLKDFYYTHLDFANMEFYRRIAKYGVGGTKKPSRNENGDLTFPVAVAMGIKNIRSMDNQTYYKEYYETWKGCERQGQSDGEIELLNKELKKLIWNEYSAVATFQHLGTASNRPKNVELMHSINSMEYRKTNTEVCDQANYYWDYRNDQMVKNTAEQILKTGDMRSIVVVGAGHVYGMMEAFARDYPEIKVLRYKDMRNNKGKVNPNDRFVSTVAYNQD